MDINNIIKNKRTELGMTMKELGDKVGVSEATISRWESGEIPNMKRSRIKKLADALGVSPLTLIGVEKEEDKKDAIHTIAAHALKDLNEEELEEVLNFARYIKSKNKSD